MRYRERREREREGERDEVRDSVARCFIERERGVGSWICVVDRGWGLATSRGAVFSFSVNTKTNKILSQVFYFISYHLHRLMIAISREHCPQV